MIKRKPKDYKIMAIDDSVGLLSDLKILFEDEGYTYEGYSDHEVAIEKIKTGNYDLLILDFMLVGITGDKIVERIREFDSELYILLLTGYHGDVPAMETMDKLDIQGYCIKGDEMDDGSQLLLLVKSGLKAVDMMNTIKKTKEGLNTILEVIPEIYKLVPINEILEEILKGIMHIVSSQSAFILVNDMSNGLIGNLNSNLGAVGEGKSIFKGLGKYNMSVEEFTKVLEADWIKFNKKESNSLGYIISGVRETGVIIKAQNYIALPLINESKLVMGVMYIESTNFEENISILSIFAKQVSNSLSNAFLHLTVNMKEEELKGTYEKLHERYKETVNILRLTVDAKDVYTRGHSDRVKFFSLKIGEGFNLSEKELELLGLSGLFHDVGKLGMGDDILKKEGRLETHEKSEMDKHPKVGARILSTVSGFKDVIQVIKYHHERMDGLGYPYALKGEDIPFLSRIISVADAFDAMTTDRSYKPKKPLEEAIEQLIVNKNTQFDEKVVNKFVELLKDYDAWRDELQSTFEVAEVQIDDE